MRMHVHTHDCWVAKAGCVADPDAGNLANHRPIKWNTNTAHMATLGRGVRMWNKPKNKTNKSSGTKVQVQPLKARHSERRCVVMVNAFKEKKHLPILCPGGSRALGHSVVNSALIRYLLTRIKKICRSNKPLVICFPSFKQQSASEFYPSIAYMFDIRNSAMSCRTLPVWQRNKNCAPIR